MNGAETIPSGYGIYLLQTVVALVAVCLLAVVVLRFLSKRLHGLGRQGKAIHLLEHLPLDQRRSLVLVEVAGKTLLIGVSDGGISLLKEVETEAVSELLEGKATSSTEPRSPGSSRSD